MDRSRVAEFLLSCVLPTERATAVTGDFLEEAGTRGRVWFWSSVARTVASRVRNDFRERPFAMIGIGIAGFLRITAFAALPLTGLFILSHFRGHHMGEPVMVNVAPAGTPPLWEPIWQINWTLNILSAVWLFGCGHWAARKMPGMEVASGIAIAVTGWMVVLALALAHSTASVVAWHDLPLIAGAVVQRRWRVA